MKYLVVRSFASLTLGSHSAGEILELDPAQAHDLGELVQVVREEAPVVETADLPVEHIEKAVKRPAKRKGE